MERVIIYDRDYEFAPDISIRIKNDIYGIYVVGEEIKLF